LKFVSSRGVDVYSLAKEIHYTLGYPSFQPTYKTYTGAGMHGLIDDVFGALVHEESNALYYQKKERSELYKALDQVIRSPEYTVTILFIYFSYVSCCFCVCVFLCELL
jgi:hypothetical protein